MRKLRNEELDRLDVEEFRESRKTPLVVILDNIRSLNNVGSVFRTSDAFLIEKIYLCGITGTPPHKDIRKTALGATRSVAWEYRQHTLALVDELTSLGYRTLAVEQAENAQRLDGFPIDPSKRYALFFGNEVKGVSQAVVTACDAVVEIPQQGTKHSLNIAVSAGIVLWHFWSRLKR